MGRTSARSPRSFTNRDETCTSDRILIGYDRKRTIWPRWRTFRSDPTRRQCGSNLSVVRWTETPPLAHLREGRQRLNGQRRRRRHAAQLQRHQHESFRIVPSSTNRYTTTCSSFGCCGSRPTIANDRQRCRRQRPSAAEHGGAVDARLRRDIHYVPRVCGRCRRRRSCGGGSPRRL